jgi:membrane-associated protease RseP (regulator of RpoE activity)
VVTVPGQVALPAARIEVWSSAGLLVHSTRTGDLGTFELRNVITGDYSIIVSQPKTVQKRFARAIGALDPHDRRVDWGTFEVSEGGSISGTVVDRLGVPVPAAHVFTVGGETITDGDGAFVLPGLPAGPLVVRARHPSAGETSHGLSVRAFAGQDTPGARLQLSGRLEPDAAPSTASRAEPGVDVSREAPLAGPTAAPTGPAIELATGRASVSVVTVIAGSAPAQAGLRSGDTIVSIDGETVSIAGQARSLLRGDTGTLVTLEIRRGGGRQRIKFRRERSGAP